MSLAVKIREQLISSFRAELAEHVQTMTDGLLAVEQGRVAGEECQSTLANVFRAAHSLKGAARAIGITVTEQLAHGLEDLLDAIRRDAIKPTPELFTACYQALDAIQAVQAAYEAGQTTPPVQALQALAGLEPFRSAGAQQSPGPRPEPVEGPAEGPHPELVEGPVEEALPTETPEGVSAGAPQPPAFTPPPSAGGDETIRVSVSKLDALMAQLSELLITKIRAEQRLTQMHELQEFVTLWQKEWLSARTAYSQLVRQDASGLLGLRRLEPVEGRRSDSSTSSPQRLEGPALSRVEGPALSRVEGAKGGDGHSKLGKDMAYLMDYVSTSQERLREMNALINTLARQYVNDTMHMSLVIDALEQEIKRVRMLPLSTITGTFGRMIRDLAREADKEAVLKIIGGDTELDKRVLEQIKDPLIHMLRNAIDHGIEPPEQRVALGKPRTGTVTLAAEQLGKDVVIRVSDDGAGLDMDAIRRVIARHGLDAQTLSEVELAEIIFKLGFSTSPIITDISGRGVGLDVVRRNVEELHGRIDMDWTHGEGTTFTLTLPLRLTSSHALLVRVSSELLAVPLSAIERILYISPKEIVLLEGHDTIRYNSNPVTLVRLDDVLDLPHTDAQRLTQRDIQPRILVLVLAAAERRMAFVVDEVVGEQEVVIKGLGRQLTRVGSIAGATVMGSGRVVLILNAADLIKLAMRSKRRSVFDALAEAAPSTLTRAERRILVVDDSITTRTLEKNILEAAGYTVELAIDGQEALSTIATSGVPDLIVADIVMPRVDGFEFTRRIKEDPHTTQVPVILVTSLDSPEDKARGIEVGADAYIVKSGFDQANLLETIEQLI